jgi:hypothetical protein
MAIDLAAPDDSGEAPERRIKGYTDATRLYTVLRDADRIPAHDRLLVQMMINGAPPRDQKAMEANGYGDLANFSSLKALADRDQAVTTFVGLADATPTLITVKTKFGDPSQRPDWEKAIAEEYTWLMRDRWESFYDREQTKAVGLVTDALALEYWPDPIDWRSEVGRPGQFLFPARASTDVAKWDLVLQVEHVQATKLYELIKKHDALKDEDKEESTINRDEVVQAIKDACKSDADNALGRDVLDRFRGNDLYASYAQSQEIKLVHYYVKEYSGKVSHYVGRADGKGENFLEEHEEVFESMNACFALFADGVGEGEIHSLQGIIRRAYDDYLQRDLLRCDIYDAAKIACKQLIKLGQGQQASEKAAQLNFGSPLVFLPPGVEPTENQFSATAIGALLPLLNEGAANIANNTGGYASHDFSPEGDQGRTATEASLQASNNAQIAGAKGINFSRASEVSHRIRFNRLINKNYDSWRPGWKERQEWLNRLLDRGVPAEAIWRVYEVKYVRPIGLGSPVAQQAAFALLDAKAGSMDPVSQRNLARDEAAARGIDYGSLDRYLPLLDVQNATPDQIIAPLENAGFGPGSPIPVYTNQDPYVHLPIHIPYLGEIQQLLQQGAIDLRMAVGKMGAALDHIQIHLKACTDLKRALLVKGWQQAFDAAAKALDNMTGQLQSQAQPGTPTIKDPVALLTAMGTALKDGAQIPNEDFIQVLSAAGINSQMPPTPQQPTVDPADALAAQKAQAEIQRNNAVAQAEIDRKNALAQQQLAHKDLKTQSEILDNTQAQPPQLPTPSAPVFPQAV